MRLRTRFADVRSVANAGSSERGRRAKAIVSVSPSTCARALRRLGRAQRRLGSSSADPAAASAADRRQHAEHEDEVVAAAPPSEWVFANDPLLPSLVRRSARPRRR